MEQKYLESSKSYFQHDLSKPAWRAKGVDKTFPCSPALSNQKAAVNKFWSSLQKWDSTVTPQKAEDRFQIYTCETTLMIFKYLLNKLYFAYINAYGVLSKGCS